MAFSSYSDALKFLYDNLPLFQRIGKQAFQNDLYNTRKLCEVLGNPEEHFRSIHVAGTNGKGSVSHMIAAILQTAGYKTGLYTSPHLKSFTERIRINGEPVNEDYVVEFTNRIKETVGIIKPSFFEVTVAMAFAYFREMNVDVAIIETGLGGRMDSTNVITPILSVITNIGSDHKDILGDTPVAIAKEKAGIIKEKIPVVIGERQEEVSEVFIEKAKVMHASLNFASDCYTVKEANGVLTILNQGHPVIADLKTDLLGGYQKKNIATVMQAFDSLKQASLLNVSQEDIRKGLEQTTILTGLKGRWQVLQRNPLIICDTAHNKEGIKEVMDQIKSHTFRNLFIVFGVVKDKEVNEILDLLPLDAHYFFCQAAIPRALDASILLSKASEIGLKGECMTDVNDAIRVAKNAAGSEDMIFIGGSTFVVAEIEGL